MTGDPRPLDRNLALELMRVTEAGALAASGAVGTHDLALADRLSVAAVRHTLASLPIDGVIVVGEGDERSGERLFLGERLGAAEEPRMDVAVDPVDGTRLVASGSPGAVCTVALAPRNTLFKTHISYMERIVVGAEASDAVDLTRSLTENIHAVAARLGRPVSEVRVGMLERPRHERLADEVRRSGAHLHLFPEGDVAVAVLAALPGQEEITMLVGIGGAPEAILTACAVLCLGGTMQARAWCPDEDQQALAEREGIEPGRILDASDLCQGGENVYMAMTGITDGELLHGVHFRPPYAGTQSLVMRSFTGTARRVESTHDLQRLAQVVGSAYQVGEAGDEAQIDVVTGVSEEDDGDV